MKCDEVRVEESDSGGLSVGALAAIVIVIIVVICVIGEPLQCSWPR